MEILLHEFERANKHAGYCQPPLPHMLICLFHCTT